MQVFVNFNFSLYFKYFLYLKKKTRYQVGWVILQAGWGSTYQDSNFSFFKLICFLTFFWPKTGMWYCRQGGTHIVNYFFHKLFVRLFLAKNRWVIRQAGSEGITLSRFSLLLLNQFIVRLFFLPKTVEWYSMERGPQMFKFLIFVNFIFLRPFFGQKQVSDTARREGGPHISEKYIFCQLKIIFLRRFFWPKTGEWYGREGGRPSYFQ